MPPFIKFRHVSGHASVMYKSETDVIHLQRYKNITGRISKKQAYSENLPSMLVKYDIHEHFKSSSLCPVVQSNLSNSDGITNDYRHRGNTWQY